MTRNPNYLGEIMLYLSFATLGGVMISYYILITAWVTLFGFNMYAKELSLRKKDGW